MILRGTRSGVAVTNVSFCEELEDLFEAVSMMQSDQNRTRLASLLEVVVVNIKGVFLLEFLYRVYIKVIYEFHIYISYIDISFLYGI